MWDQYCQHLGQEAVGNGWDLESGILDLNAHEDKLLMTVQITKLA